MPWPNTDATHCPTHLGLSDNRRTIKEWVVWSLVVWSGWPSSPGTSTPHRFIQIYIHTTYLTLTLWMDGWMDGWVIELEIILVPKVSCQFGYFY